MEQQPVNPAVRAVAFAAGLRKSVAAGGRRWAAWPGGSEALAIALDCIDYIRQRLLDAPETVAGEAAVTACVAELRAILEWTTYQSACVATARALVSARKVRAFAREFGVAEDGVSGLSALAESEASLLDNIALKSGYMNAIAERYPHLELPRPLVEPAALAPRPAAPSGKLALIAQLMKSANQKRRR